MKDDFDEDFLEKGFQESIKQKSKSGKTLIVDVGQFEIFKKEGICEREFYNFDKCKAKANENEMNKNFCDNVKKLLVQCITRSGKEIYK
jgi:hypothetical protein